MQTNIYFPQELVGVKESFKKLVGSRLKWARHVDEWEENG